MTELTNEALCALAKGGSQAATDELLRRNQRLLYLWLRSFMHRRIFSHDWDDLWQEACIGLLRCIQKFDPDRGFKFTTALGWFVRGQLNSAVNNRDATVRLPVHHRGNYALRDSLVPASLNKPMADYDDELGDLIADAGVDIAETLDAREDREHVQQMLSRCTPREQYVIVHHYGLLDGIEPMTLREIGKLLHVSCARTRVIENKAFASIKRGGYE